MCHLDAASTPRRPPTTYRLQVQGPLPSGLADELDGFTVQAGSATTLTGPVTDAADLYGLIARLECFGLTLVSVQASASATPPELAVPDIPTPHRSTTITDTARDDVAPTTTLSNHSRLRIAAGLRLLARLSVAMSKSSVVARKSGASRFRVG